MILGECNARELPDFTTRSIRPLALRMSGRLFVGGAGHRAPAPHSWTTARSAGKRNRKGGAWRPRPVKFGISPSCRRNPASGRVGAILLLGENPRPPHPPGHVPSGHPAVLTAGGDKAERLFQSNRLTSGN